MKEPAGWKNKLPRGSNVKDSLLWMLQWVFSFIPSFRKLNCRISETSFIQNFLRNSLIIFYYFPSTFFTILSQYFLRNYRLSICFIDIFWNSIYLLFYWFHRLISSNPSTQKLFDIFEELRSTILIPSSVDLLLTKSEKVSQK